MLLATAALLVWLAFANITGAWLVWRDKVRARRLQRRVRERTFHVLALLGGWPGEAIAFVAAHHKTRKPRFLIPFFLCALVNAAALWWMWQRGWF